MNAPSRTGGFLITLAALLAACAGPVPKNAEEREVRAAPAAAAAPAWADLRQEYGVTVTASDTAEGRREVRTSRLRLRDRAATHERWLLRTEVFIAEANGSKRLAKVDEVVLYDGPPLSDSLHSRYGGSFMIAPGKTM